MESSSFKLLIFLSGSPVSATENDSPKCSQSFLRCTTASHGQDDPVDQELIIDGEHPAMSDIAFAVKPDQQPV